jgi:hypothetical protein
LNLLPYLKVEYGVSSLSIENLFSISRKLILKVIIAALMIARVRITNMIGVKNTILILSTPDNSINGLL